MSIKTQKVTETTTTTKTYELGTLWIYYDTAVIITRHVTITEIYRVYFISGYYFTYFSTRFQVFSIYFYSREKKYLIKRQTRFSPVTENFVFHLRQQLPVQSPHGGNDINQYPPLSNKKI
jgi:hypothetical protein